jgi:ABC-type glycerol-3-phosphate transport system substrate-binding protein
MSQLFRFLPFLIIFLTLSACTDASTEAPPLHTDTPDAPGERTLVVWTHDFPSFKDGIADKWIPEFEAANPGVKVDYTALPYSGEIVSFDTRLLAEVSSGGGPDVWAMASFNFIEEDYIEAGLLAPLDPTMFGYDSVEDLVSDYPPNSLNIFVRDGQIYGLLNELTTLCLFYNQDVFDDAGISYLAADKPASWQEIADISEQLLISDPATGDPTRMGYQFGFFANYPSPQWYIQDFYPILRQFGQDDLYLDGEPAATSKAVVSAFQVFYDFTYKYQAYDPYFPKDWFGEFSNGRVAMLTAGPWFPSATSPGVRFGVAPHPVVNPDDPATYQDVMYSFGWVINADLDPQQRELAQAFLAFILGKKGEAEQPLWWLENVGVMQPRTAFLESPGYQEIIDRDEWMKCFIDTFDDYSVDYYQHSSDEAGMALVRAMDRVVYNQMSPEDTARLLQNELLLLP